MPSLPDTMYSVYMFLVTVIGHIYIASTALIYSPAAQIVQGVILLLILGYNSYSIWKQKMPRSLFLVLFFAIFVMMSMLFIGTLLVLLHLADTKSNPILMLTDKVIQQLEQAIFFGILFQIDCEILRLFSVLNPKITDRRINKLRNIWLIIYAIGCVFIIASYWAVIPISLASPLAILFGGPVLIFDVVVSLYMLYKLIKLKRASVETANVTEAISVLLMVVFMAFYAIYAQARDGPRLVALDDTQFLCLTVEIAALFCLHYGLCIELFTHVRLLAISKATDPVEVENQSTSNPASSPAVLMPSKRVSDSPGEKDTVKFERI